jgi:putative NIF3 family GTP cyclohydrolase 1 type 2
MTNPFAGRKGEMHMEPETRIETIMPSYISGKVVAALIEAHPYEEAAYDLYPLANTFTSAGMGCIGETGKDYSEQEFLAMLAEKFNAEGIRYSSTSGKPVRKVAMCGGAGASLNTPLQSERGRMLL